MTNIHKAAREALGAVDALARHEHFGSLDGGGPAESAIVSDGDWVRHSDLMIALATLRAALDEAPGEEREAFEAWKRVDNTLPLDRDAHGYADFTTGLLWHVWQAAQRANAPGGALAGGESGADARLGLAGANVTCRHDFVLQPSSSIELCARCGVSKTAARAMLAARPAAPTVALTDEQIAQATDDVYLSDYGMLSDYDKLIARAAIAKFCEVNGLAAPEEGNEGGA